MENLGKQSTEKLVTGIIDSIEKSIGNTIGSTTLLGGKLGDVLTSSISKMFSDNIDKGVAENISKEINNFFEELLGKENIVKEAAANRAISTKKEGVKVAQSRDQLTLERQDALRVRKDAQLNLQSINKGILSNQEAYDKGSRIRAQLYFEAGLETDAQKLKEIESSISEITDILGYLITEEDKLFKARE
ncbi:MAG: hypothetical protein ACKPGB_16625, partial [Dolichospermum sp.]